MKKGVGLLLLTALLMGNTVLGYYSLVTLYPQVGMCVFRALSIRFLKRLSGGKTNG